MKFGWDDGKRAWVWNDRAIDFEDMKMLFDGRPRMTIESPRADEERLISVARIKGRLFAVIWMWRGDTIWIITARRAWKSEEKRFAELTRSEDE